MCTHVHILLIFVGAVPSACPVSEMQDSSQTSLAAPKQVIPNGTWILQALQRDGKNCDQSEIDSLKQCLLIHNDLFVLLRSGEPDLIGTIKVGAIEPSGSVHYTISLLATDPRQGGIAEYAGIFRFVTDNKSAYGTMVICRNDDPQKSPPQKFSSHGKGIVLETYKFGKFIPNVNR